MGSNIAIKVAGGMSRTVNAPPKYSRVKSSGVTLLMGEKSTQRSTTQGNARLSSCLCRSLLNPKLLRC